jgi:hypothetical protein
MIPIGRYAIIQSGEAIWGSGETIRDAIADANQWLDEDRQILGFEDHDHLGAFGGLTDWTNGRRYPVASGDMIITDDPEVIDETC